MKEERDYSGIISLVIYLLLFYGYFANIYKLTQCDFDTPMRAEAYRITGVVLFPVGIVQGYMDIEDGKN
jgi:hypothetical protein